MDEKEVKKIDEKGEEKVSGGLTEISKEKLKGAFVTLPEAKPFSIRDFISERLKDKKNKKEKKPEEALTPSQPKTEEKNK